MLAFAEFAFAAWHFALQGGMRDMTPDAFTKFVYRIDNRADTPYLRKRS